MSLGESGRLGLLPDVDMGLGCRCYVVGLCLRESGRLGLPYVGTGLGCRYAHGLSRGVWKASSSRRGYGIGMQTLSMDFLVESGRLRLLDVVMGLGCRCYVLGLCLAKSGKLRGYDF